MYQLKLLVNGKQIKIKLQFYLFREYLPETILSNLETKDLGVVNGKRRKEYTLTYTIPQNYNEDVVTIVPNKYIDNCTMPGDDDIFNIVIKNESVNTYSYLNNSFTYILLFTLIRMPFRI